MTDETIFAVALEKRDPAERSAYLDEACGGDRGLRQRVEALLASHDKVGNFLERPAVEQFAPPGPGEVTGAEQHGNGEEDALGFLQPSTKPGSLGRLGHYEVLEVLGRGAFGIVLKAFDEKLHRVVAIKVMAPHLASTSPPRKRFLREARSAAAIRHDNVVGIYAVEDQPIPYLVMEYIAGETLQQKLDRMGPLEVADVLRIGQQVAGGLAAAHALGLIHRDIKPSNILLENGVEPRVKITDFGLARAADDASLTQSGLIAGTPLYMAPEQAQGEVIDQRADLFSLGSVLYVLCTGRPPFRAPNTLAVLKRVAEDTPRPIRELIPEVPKWLCAIVARLHAKKPEERFGSAREVADLLARHLAKLQQDRGLQPLSNAPPPAPKSAPAAPEPVQSAGPKIEARPAPAPALRPPLPRKRRWAAAAVVLVLLLAGVGLSEATGVTNVRGTVIRLFAPEGTVVVEVDDPDVSVTIDGEQLVITGAGARAIRLKPGQYQIQASKDGKLVSQELITVARNGRQVVRVSKETAPVADAGKREKPGAAPPNPPAPRPLDLKYVPADASAALVVHPRRIVQSPLVAGALPAGAADEMLKELGVKPEQVEQVIVLLQVEGAEPAPVPAAIIRLTESVDGNKILTGLLKGLREEKHEGKVYYRSSTGEALLGLPLAGALPDERTVLVAPEPILRKMLAADSGAKSPLLDRLRQTDDTDEMTGIVIVEPYRNLLNGLLGPFKEQLPADLADAAKLPDRLVSVTATVNLRDKTLLKVTPEADSEEDVEALDQLAFKGLNWARKVYPDFRPNLLRQLPAEVVQPALAIADQLFGGIQVTKEGKRLVIRLEKPEALATPLENEVIASSGFNDARGMNSNPVPGSPFPLDTPNREGGAGEPGWAGPWSAHPDAVFQSKVVFEGDGALYLKGRPNFGPNYGRQLAQAQTGRFQVEFRLQVPAGSSCGGCVWKDPHGGAFNSGPNWGAGRKFWVDGQDTGFKCLPGRWYKVTLRIDVPKQTWEFFVDDRRFESTQKFRAKAEYLDVINFLVEGGVYSDALRVTRLPDDATKDDLIASSGFNDAKGVNSNPVPGSPYPLDIPNREGGVGEPGWKGPWLAHPKATFQSKVVFEGDGALYLQGSPNVGPNYGRQLAKAQTGKFQVEYRVQVPAGSSFAGYVWQDPWQDGRGGPFHSGPNWGAGGGQFTVHSQDTGLKCVPGQWHKVTLRIDVAKQTWDFFVDDKRFESPKPLPFRTKVEYLDVINFLVEGGVYIDALRVTRLPDAEKKKSEEAKRPDVGPPPAPGGSGIEEKKGQGEEKRPDVGPRTPVARGPLDLKYIPADASAAVVVHPRRILRSPLAAASLPPGAAEEMVRELGVKPEQVEQVIVLLQAGAIDPAAVPPPKDAPDPDLTPIPGAIIRFAEPVDGKQVLTHLLKGLREERHEGKTYYRSSTGEALLGLPLAGALPDGRTVLVAPEPVLRKMLAADGGAKSPLLDRLRQTDTTDDIAGIAIVEPYRNLLKALVEPLKARLPPDLAEAAGLPDRVVAVTAAANLSDQTLLKVSLEADSEESVEVLDDLVFKGLNWARKVYPDFRPTLLRQLPAEVVQPALAIVDQLYGGIRVTREGKRLVVRLEKPEGLGTPPEDDLIAAAGFNDAQGINSDRVPGLPYPLDSEGKKGGVGEPGWAGPWSTPSSPQFSFQRKVVHEGDGALYMSKGSADRRLAEALGGQFQVEMFVQVPAGGGFICYLKNGGAAWAGDGPVWNAGDGKFGVLGDDDKLRATGFSSEPGKWHKVTLRVDVPRNEWQFFVDDQKFETPRPLHFRRSQASLDTIWFQCETQAGIYVDALRITRQGLVTPPPKDLIASSGFNDARGMNSNPVPGSPFPLDIPNREGGLGEPGWAGPWDANPDIVFQSKVVFEGDGALYLKGRPNFGPYCRRQLAQAQTGKFQVEYRVQVPAGTNYSLQFWKEHESGPFVCGPISGVQDGKFTANEVPDTGFKCEPGRWYKVTMRIDVPKQTWEFFVDDKHYDAPQPLKFRAKVEYLSCINFIVGQGGAYFDALRVTRLPSGDR